MVVVRRDRLAMHASLRRSFEPDQRVEVILDRRQTNRRVRTEAMPTDRRRQQRRQPPTATEAASWEVAGASLIVRAGSPL